MDEDDLDGPGGDALPHQLQPELKWSGQFEVAKPSGAAATSDLPGDKIVLPQEALEQLLAAAPSVTESGPADSRSTFDPFNPHTFAAERHARAYTSSTQQQLPHPLTFRLVGGKSGRVVYAGIKEFSAETGQIRLSRFLEHALGLDNVGTDDSARHVTVHARQLPKGSYVKLRPLEAGYDVQDWKSLLEEHMRKNYTTLTKGEILTVPAGRDQYRFLIDELKPASSEAVCVVDTDLEVDIEALNEEQARETLERIAAKRARAPGTEQGSSAGGTLDLFRPQAGQVLPGEYVDYEVPSWDRAGGIELVLAPSEPGEMVLLASPYGPRQRARPRLDEHAYADFEHAPGKRLRLSPAQQDLEEAEAIWVSVHVPAQPTENTASTTPRAFTLRAALPSSGQPTESTNGDTEVGEGAQQQPGPDEVQCKNCGQMVPRKSLVLHENFCLRNNVLCTKGCGRVYKKNSDEFVNHVHCRFDETCDTSSVWFDSPAAHERHLAIFHTTVTCPACDLELFNTPALAHHRTTICPGKLILCRFCHLEVPQESRQGVEGEVLLTGLTPHELADGARTTECHLCGRITRLRDMDAHLRHHDLERKHRPTPRACRNANCGRTLDGTSRSGDTRAQSRDNGNDVGLCATCFGPLYVSMHDPEGKALRRRVERKYLGQLLTGCGQPWCHNKFCKTSRGTSAPAVTTKEALPLIKPFVDGLLGGKTPLHFCVDERSQQSRTMADMLAAEGQDTWEKQYDIAWCVGALEAESGDVAKARDWLRNFAP